MKFIEYDGKFTELEKIIALQDSRLELLTGLVNQLRGAAESQTYVPSYAISTPTGARLPQQAPAPVNRGVFAACAATTGSHGPVGPNVAPGASHRIGKAAFQENNVSPMQENPFGVPGPGQMPSAPMHQAAATQFAGATAQMGPALPETPPLIPHQTLRCQGHGDMPNRPCPMPGHRGWARAHFQ